MIFGIPFTFTHVILMGVLLFALLAFQMLVGLRKIRFKGRTHQKVHRWTAWAILGVAVVHGLTAATVYFGLRIG
ncbi:MAG: hypothetical protein HY876_09490 [Coriobacteriales bacterium]|nr:hypothetical protein [Coriobacteriales bacterium]